MQVSKRNIAIVCGGDSSEYEVSIHSAQGLYAAFDHTRYNLYVAIVRRDDWHIVFDDQTTAEIDKSNFSFTHQGQTVCIDYAYITIHGTPGENGIIQGYFEMIGIPYSTCSVLVEALTFDKYVLNNFLRSFGYNIADSILLRRDSKEMPSPTTIVDRLGLPCFVKPTADGSSFGVSKVKTLDELQPALDKAFAQCNEIMVERYMNGTEIAVGCFKTKTLSAVLPATEVVSENEFFDYDAKYNGQVDEITPARIKPETASEVARLTSELYDLLHCNGIIRIDYIIEQNADGTDKVNLLEINTTPGMTATSFIPQQMRAANINITDALTAIVENQF